jgi:transposase
LPPIVPNGGDQRRWLIVDSPDAIEGSLCFSPRPLSRAKPSQANQTCRRVATRYDKLAANYVAFVQIASIRLWLRAL